MKVAHADLDGDGYEDIVVARGTNADPVTADVFFGDSRGDLTPGPSVPAPDVTSRAAVSLVPADINQDGALDVVLWGNVALLGANDGTFTKVTLGATRLALEGASLELKSFDLDHGRIRSAGTLSDVSLARLLQLRQQLTGEQSNLRTDLVFDGDWDSYWELSIASVEVVDPQAGAVGLSLPDLEVPRFDHTATLLADGRVLVAGGKLVAIGAVPLIDDEPDVPGKNHYILALRAARALPADAPINEVTTSAEIYQPPQ